jgi:hypothetical protein
MTLDDFERLVLKLANQMPTRYWKHWNHPCCEQWLMAVQFHIDRPEPRLMKELEERGLQRSNCYPDDPMFTVERTFP